MIDRSWDKVWKDFHSLNFFGRRLIKETEKKCKEIFSVFIPKNFSVIEIGCGGGHTLAMWKKLGYKNVVGIDPSENALKLCERYGFKINEDIFLCDSGKWKEKKDVVFSHGMLEHYDYVPMKEIGKDFARLSKRFIILIQPNPDSLVHIIRKIIRKSKWERERRYKEKDYIQLFDSLGFTVIYRTTLNYFNEDYFLLFEKKLHLK